MWFTEFAIGDVGAVSNGKFSEYPLTFSPSDSIDITVGSDKNLWAATDHNGILKITPSGNVTENDLPNGGDASRNQPQSRWGRTAISGFLKPMDLASKVRTTPTSGRSHPKENSPSTMSKCMATALESPAVLTKESGLPTQAVATVLLHALALSKPTVKG